MLENYLCLKFDVLLMIVGLMVWTFVCTKELAIIKDKSNIEWFICIVENKFCLPP